MSKERSNELRTERSNELRTEDPPLEPHQEAINNESRKNAYKSHFLPPLSFRAGNHPKTLMSLNFPVTPEVHLHFLFQLTQIPFLQYFACSDDYLHNFNCRQKQGYFRNRISCNNLPVA